MTFKRNMWHVACEKFIIQHVLVLPLHFFVTVRPSFIPRIVSHGIRLEQVEGALKLLLQYFAGLPTTVRVSP